MKVRTLPIFSVCMVLFFLVGCSTSQVKVKEDFLQVKRNQLTAEGNSQDFVDGYINGCASGKSAVGDKNYTAKKDELRYSQSRDYNIGWERGYYECRDASISKLQHKVHQEYVPAENPEEEMERMKIWEELKK
jgi:hypothetical protein